MKVSVLLASYNGSKYIENQMISLLEQTRVPDEVLIVDDCSSDDTCIIVRSFINKNNLINWTLNINNKNKGWKKNFIDGLQVVTGDLIFLCDQDDVWYKDKIEIMAKEMEKNNKISVLASNYKYLYEKSAVKIPVILLKRFKNTDKIYQYKFRENFIWNIRPGCSMCVRKNYVEIIIDKWSDGYAHDAFLFHFANYTDGFYLLDATLLYQRKHAESAAAFTRKLTNSHQRLHIVQDNIDLIYKLIDMNQNVDRYDFKYQILQEALKWCELRRKFFQTRNIIYWFIMIKYLPYYLSGRTYFGDLYSLMIKK